MKRTIKSFSLLLLAIATMFFACKKNDNSSEKIVITRVSLHNATTTDATVNQVRLGSNVRVDGAGFSNLTGVYLNGVKIGVNPGFVTENTVIFQIPFNLPFGRDVAEDVRNKIRLVSRTDDYTYDFIIQGSAPVITNVSHALPKDGERIEIYGTSLRDLNKITFPGGASLGSDQFTVNEDFTVITCVVPSGATSQGGAIRVEGDNGAAISNNFMNRNEGVFIINFNNDPNVSGGEVVCNQRVYNFGSTNLISGNLTAQLPATGDWTKNPAVYRQVPISPTNIAVDFAAGFDFRTCAALTSVLNTSGATINENTLVNTLAIQYDIFIPVAWSSGFIRLDFVSNDTQWRFNYAPWVSSTGVATPLTMNGWRTVTIPFSSFTGLNIQKITTYKSLQTFMSGKSGAFRFVNGNYTSPAGGTFAAKGISNFLCAFGGFRIVPYSKPTL